MHIQYVRHFGNGTSDLQLKLSARHGHLMLFTLHNVKCRTSVIASTILFSCIVISNTWRIIIILCRLCGHACAKCHVCLCALLAYFDKCRLHNIYARADGIPGDNQNKTIYFRIMTKLNVLLFIIINFPYLTTLCVCGTYVFRPPSRSLRVVGPRACCSRLNGWMVWDVGIIYICAVCVPCILWMINSSEFTRVPFSFCWRYLRTDWDGLSSPVYCITNAEDGIRQSRCVLDKFNRKIWK